MEENLKKGKGEAIYHLLYNIRKNINWGRGKGNGHFEEGNQDYKKSGGEKFQGEGNFTHLWFVVGPDPMLPYTDPRGPVHLVTGSAGCREKHDGFIPNPPPWSVVRSSEYGFTIMKVGYTFFLLNNKNSPSCNVF